MRRIAAISAVVLVVAVFAYLLPAQDRGTNPFAYERPAKPDASFPAPGSGRIAEPIDVEPRVSALANEFSKSLTSALQEKIVNAEQAERMVKELEVAFTAKRVQLDLLRVVKVLEEVDETAKGIPGAEDLQRLRQELKQLGASAIPRPAITLQPTLAPSQSVLRTPEE